MRILVLLGLVGCAGPDDAYQCHTEPISVSQYDQTDVAYTAQDVTDWLEQPIARALSWSAEDRTTALTLNVEVNDIWLVREDTTPDDPRPSTCEGHYELESTLYFATSDAKFAEAWTVFFTATSSQAVTFQTEVGVGELMGDFAMTMVDWDLYDDVELDINLLIEPESTSGHIEATGFSSTDNSGFSVADW